LPDLAAIIEFIIEVEWHNESLSRLMVMSLSSHLFFQRITSTAQAAEQSPVILSADAAGGAFLGGLVACGALLGSGLHHCGRRSGGEIGQTCESGVPHSQSHGLSPGLQLVSKIHDMDPKRADTKANAFARTGTKRSNRRPEQ